MDEKTIGEVLKTFNDDQMAVLQYLVFQAMTLRDKAEK